MFRLGHQVGSDASRIAVFADDDRFGGTSQEFNGAIESHQFLGCGHVSVAWTDDLVDARDAFRSISKGSNGLCPTDSVELAHAQECCRRQRCLRRARRRDANLSDTSDLRGNHRHEHRGRQGIPAARHIAPHRFERTHQLAHRDARLNFASPFICRWGRLPLRVTTNIARSLLDRVLQFWISFSPSLLKVSLGNTKWFALAQSVPTCGVAAYGAVAVTADVTHNAADCRLDLC